MASLPCPSDTARLFLALWPDAAVRDAIVRAQAAWRWPAGVRLVPPERLHLTLHFIGAVPRDRLAALEPALAVPMPCFELQGGNAQAWPHGLAVQGVKHVPRALLALHDALGAAIADAGLPLESRPYRPHITLARRAEGAIAPPGTAPWRWQVAGYRLVESMPGGAGYRTLAGYGAGAVSSSPSAPTRAAKRST